jgi:hypothetical protein
MISAVEAVAFRYEAQKPSDAAAPPSFAAYSTTSRDTAEGETQEGAPASMRILVRPSSATAVAVAIVFAVPSVVAVIEVALVFSP